MLQLKCLSPEITHPRVEWWLGGQLLSPADIEQRWRLQDWQLSPYSKML